MFVFERRDSGLEDGNMSWGAVTVVTRGHIGGDIRVAQRRGLAVIRVAIMFEPILVALAATHIAGHFEMAFLRRFNCVALARTLSSGCSEVRSGWQSQQVWPLWADAASLVAFHVERDSQAGGVGHGQILDLVTLQASGTDYCLGR